MIKVGLFVSNAIQLNSSLLSLGVYDSVVMMTWMMSKFFLIIT